METNSELVQVSSSDYNSSLSMTSIVGAAALVFSGETFETNCKVHYGYRR